MHSLSKEGKEPLGFCGAEFGLVDINTFTRDIEQAKKKICGAVDWFYREVMEYSTNGERK